MTVDILTLNDRIKANDYRSDRYPAVPFSPLDSVMQNAQDVLGAEDVWSGVITPSCTDHSERIVVSREVGVGLRIGGEANLCFDCGPDGGHYHPGVSWQEAVSAAARLDVIVRNR